MASLLIRHFKIRVAYFPGSSRIAYTKDEFWSSEIGPQLLATVKREIERKKEYSVISNPTLFVQDGRLQPVLVSPESFDAACNNPQTIDTVYYLAVDSVNLALGEPGNVFVLNLEGEEGWERRTTQAKSTTTGEAGESSSSGKRKADEKDEGGEGTAKKIGHNSGTEFLGAQSGVV